MSCFRSLGLMCRSLLPVSSSLLEGPKWMTSFYEGWWPGKEKGQECVHVINWESTLASQTQHLWPRPPPQKEMNVLWDVCMCVLNLNMLVERNVTGSDSFMTYQIVFKCCLMSITSQGDTAMSPSPCVSLWSDGCADITRSLCVHWRTGPGAWDLARGRPPGKTFQVTLPQAAPLSTK